MHNVPKLCNFDKKTLYICVRLTTHTLYILAMKTQHLIISENPCTIHVWGNWSGVFKQEGRSEACDVQEL